VYQGFTRCSYLFNIMQSGSCVLRFQKNRLPLSTRLVDRAMVQALIEQLLTAKTRVRFQVSKYRICSGQSSTGTSPRTTPSISIFGSHCHSTYTPYSSIHLSRAAECRLGLLSNGVKTRKEVRKQSRQCSKQDGPWSLVPSKGQIDT